MVTDQKLLSEALEQFIEVEFTKLKQEIAEAFAKLRQHREAESLSAR
jgi:hypothetical protein